MGLINEMDDGSLMGINDEVINSLIINTIMF